MELRRCHAAEQHASPAAIAPKSTEEVQAVVKIANQYGIPLWPVSTGRNLAYGGAAPAMRGTVVLDLKRMKRILEIDEDLGYALVEPGVSFFDLHDALAERGDKLWISSPAPGWGSRRAAALAGQGRPATGPALSRPPFAKPRSNRVLIPTDICKRGRLLPQAARTPDVMATLAAARRSPQATTAAVEAVIDSQQR